MPRGIDKVKDVFLSLVFIFHLYGMALDGDATLLLQFHIIQHLPFCDLYGVCVFKQAVCQCAFSVVDMGDNAKVSYMSHCLLDVFFWIFNINLASPLMVFFFSTLSCSRLIIYSLLEG